MAVLVMQLAVATAGAQSTAQLPAARSADPLVPAVAAPAVAQTDEQVEQARLIAQGRQVDESRLAAAAAASRVQNMDGASAPASVGAQALAGDGRRSIAPPISARLSLYAGEAAVRRVPGEIRRVAVGNGEVLSAFTVGKDELVLIGTAAGETNVHLWMASGAQRDISVTVAGIKGDNLAATVRRLLGDVPGLVVEPVGSNVVVTGVEMDESTSARLVLLQKTFPQILNFAGTDPVGMRPMVMMDVHIMEFSKDSLEELGIQWDSVITGPVGGLLRDFITNDYFRVSPESEPGLSDIADTLPLRLPGPQGYLGIATTIGSRINLLMNRGKAWILASPKLSAKSGSSATFLVGGEIPIVIPSILGQSQVEYKEYGIRLEITPTVNLRNQVSTAIMAEVSQIDPSVTVQDVPGFLTRRTETEVNVNIGETIVLSGLLDRSASKTADKLPILGDIPILGKLFRSDGFRSNRTELVVFVTPRLISPTSPNNLQHLQRADELQQSLESDMSQRQRTLLNR